MATPTTPTKIVRGKTLPLNSIDADIRRSEMLMLQNFKNEYHRRALHYHHKGDHRRAAEFAELTDAYKARLAIFHHHRDVVMVMA